MAYSLGMGVSRMGLSTFLYSCIVQVDGFCFIKGRPYIMHR
jgi:hypothetical protein